ncbi:MAG: isoprenylcysteine carboxylmethyltransferase family protein [Candidatus Omnitrophica bacterium]|nr:isoprenylcysteine carboxylmethyltransferase family protein [Candidatus Omnitrophota bacterium]
MKNRIDEFLALVKTGAGRFELGVTLIIGLCILFMFLAILINFVESKKNAKPVKEKKSVVATFSMTLFFIGFYLLLRFNLGVLPINNIWTRVVLALAGVSMVAFGTFVNIKSRLTLSQNWSDQIKIYQNHSLVKSGFFAMVRHPLYSSLMLMFYGASLVYLNFFAFLANGFIFIPFMYYRAKQEEKLLIERFPEYSEYRRNTGMFFPKLK